MQEGACIFYTVLPSSDNIPGRCNHCWDTFMSSLFGKKKTNAFLYICVAFFNPPSSPFGGCSGMNPLTLRKTEANACCRWNNRGLCMCVCQHTTISVCVCVCVSIEAHTASIFSILLIVIIWCVICIHWVMLLTFLTAVCHLFSLLFAFLCVYLPACLPEYPQK